MKFDPIMDRKITLYFLSEDVKVNTIQSLWKMKTVWMIYRT